MWLSMEEGDLQPCSCVFRCATFLALSSVVDCWERRRRSLALTSHVMFQAYLSRCVASEDLSKFRVCTCSCLKLASLKVRCGMPAGNLSVVVKQQGERREQSKMFTGCRHKSLSSSLNACFPPKQGTIRFHQTRT